ncbi:MAG: response regulator [Chloroflexota bacterium]
MDDVVHVIIAEDHPIFRRGLVQVCQDAPLIQVVGEAQNGADAVELALRLRPDVILMDIQMPVLDGIQATGRILAQAPQTGIIILTVSRTEEHIFSAIRAGARGYLLKDVEQEALVQAIYAVARGEALIDPNIAWRVLEEFKRMSESRPVAPELQQLTEVETDILKLVAQGEDNPAIARRLNISEKTVVNRLTTIYQKLHVNNRTQAAILALRQGIVGLHPGQNS